MQESWSFLRSTIPIIDAEGVWQNQIENLIWGFTDDFGPHSFVWSPDSRFLAFIDDALGSEGEDFLEIAAVSPGGSYKRLAAGASGTPSWQPIVRR